MPTCPHCGLDHEGDLCVGGPTAKIPRRYSEEAKDLLSGADTDPDATPEQHDRTLAIEPGTVLGSYRLLEVIGEGAIGRVYLAEHTKLGRKVALKLLRSKWSKNRTIVKRFFGEARAVNKIAHENIVTITDFAEESDGTYYIMDLLQGETIEEILERDGSIGTTRTIEITRQICRALRAVHDKGIVHRDLKPANVFISEPGSRESVRLLDFGVAKLSDLGDEMLRHQTAVGSLVGTPAFMSPEQSMGAGVDHRADIYALGVLLYQMLTGKNPFASESLEKVLELHRTVLPPPPASIRQMPKALSDLIIRCLQKDPEDRPQRMSEVLAVLDGMQGGSSRWILAAVATVFVVAGVGYMSMGGPAEVEKPKTAARRASDAAVSERATEVLIKFTSTPPGAEVSNSENTTTGVTPFEISMLRSEDQQHFEFRLSGYQPVVRSIVPQGNILLDVWLTPVQAKRKKKAAKAVKKRRRAKKIRRRSTKQKPTEIEPTELRNPYD